MGFLDRIGLDSIKSEKDFLMALRDAAENWYNELTIPLISVVSPPDCPQRTSEMSDEEYENFVSETIQENLTNEQYETLKNAATELMNARYLINSGDKLANKMAEKERSIGIPFFSGRKSLKENVDTYLNSGGFLKHFMTYGFSSFNAATDGGVAEARGAHSGFRSAKDELVKQINTQLANIG